MKEYRRLDGSIVPENYRLHFDTNARTFRFDGIEEIVVAARRPCREIRMYANGLRIKSASVSHGDRMLKARVSYSGKSHNLVLSLPEAVKGAALISIEFSGKNNDQMYGFYRSVYREGGRKRYMMTSDFEPADARAMFPCFDEPSFKATFDASVTIDRGMKAVSNMPARSERALPGGRRLVRFMTTPRMSTYLFHLSVGDFRRYTKRDGNLEISLVSPRKVADPSMPLDFAARFVRFYESYFGIRYPLPKLDMIALPDFRAGAMENWGAITFRESRLVGDSSAPVAIRERIAEVIAHEFAHQWFGDLVTMKWWDDLWLNESFATFMSHKAMDAAFPEWGMQDRFLDMVAALAFNADSVRSTHPISVRVEDAERIGELFDEISYEKGCMVLHMVEDYIGPETFRRGLHRYLMGHRYGNAAKEDLWNALQEECRKEGRETDVAHFVKSWIEQPGHPVVSFSGGKRPSLGQDRFVMYGPTPKQEWVVPVRYATESSGGVEVMRRRTAPTKISMPAKLNLNQDYFYRVRYDRRTLERLGERVKRGSLSYRDGWGLENDLFALMLASDVGLDRYMEFVDRYCVGSGYPMAYNTSMHLASLYSMLYHTDRRAEAAALSMRFHKRLIDECGMESVDGESNRVTLLRSRAFSNLGLLGYGPVVEAAERYVSRRTGAPADLRASAYAVAAWNGGRRTFGMLKSMYAHADDPSERVRLLQAISMASTRSLIKEALDFSLSSAVRLQDSSFIPLTVSGVAVRSSDGIRVEQNPAGKAYIWPWMRDSWPAITRRFTVETHILDKVVLALSVVSDRRQAAEIMRFFSARRNSRPDISTRLAAVKDSIRANIRFMERNGISGKPS